MVRRGGEGNAGEQVVRHSGWTHFPKTALALHSSDTSGAQENAHGMALSLCRRAL